MLSCCNLRPAPQSPESVCLCLGRLPLLSISVLGDIVLHFVLFVNRKCITLSLMNNDKIEKTEASSEYTEQSHSVTDQYPAAHRRSPLLAILVTLGVSVVGIAGFSWLVWTSSIFDKPADA